jgi:hypothetical protein
MGSNLIFHIFSFLVSIFIPISLIYFWGLTGLDFDNGIQWTEILLTKNIWNDYPHHPYIIFTLNIFQNIILFPQDQLNKTITIYIIFYSVGIMGFSFIVSLFSLKSTQKILIIILTSVSPCLLYQLRSLEDNLIGFPFLVWALYYFISYIHKPNIKKIIASSVLSSLSLVIGLTYIGWIGGLGLGFLVFPFFVSKNWKDSLKNAIIYGFLTIILVLILSLMKDFASSKNLFYTLKLFSKSPYELYCSFVSQFSVSLLGFSWSILSTILAIFGLDTFMATSQSLKIYILFFAIFITFIYITYSNFKKNSLYFPLCMGISFAGLFNMAYNATSLDNTYYERGDWVVLAIPLFLILLIIEVNWKWKNLILVFFIIAPLSSYLYFQRNVSGEYKEMTNAKKNFSTYFYDYSYFLEYGKEDSMSEHITKTLGNLCEEKEFQESYSAIGMLNLAFDNNCYIYNSKNYPEFPTKCKYINQKEELLEVVKKSSNHYSQNLIKYEIGELSDNPDCNTLLEQFKVCSSLLTQATPKVQKKLQESILNVCNSDPFASLKCLTKYRDSCRPFNGCVMKNYVKSQNN